MDWLLNGPIGGMAGPDFLKLYAVVIVVTLVVTLLLRPLFDPTRGAEPPQVPDRPDVFELAYLRGGASEVAQLALVTLIDRGYLWHNALGNTISPAPNPPQEAPRWPILQTALATLGDQPWRGYEAVNVVAAACGPACRTYEGNLREQRLLTTDHTRRAQTWLVAAAFLLVEGLGVYKLAVALAKGKSNVGFLLMMMLVAGLVLPLCIQSRRLSACGERYMSRVRQRFAGQRDLLDADGRDLDAAMLVFAAFGMTALSGAAWAWTSTAFMPPQQTSDGGCSSTTSSCSGSSCSGSSCSGGGCGGCSS